jgi:hypothetical protein
MNDGRACVLLVVFACCVPIFAIIGGLMLDSHLYQSALPVGLCDFTDLNNVSHDSWAYDYSSLGGGYKSCTYGRWTVKGSALLVVGNQSYRINVTGIYPAPRQRLNLVCSSQCDVEQRTLAIRQANCSVDIGLGATPDPSQTYNAYPQIMHLAGGVTLLVLAGVIAMGFCVGFCFLWKKSGRTFPEPLSI